VLGATATTPAGEVDVHCASLGDVLAGGYYGPYGAVEDGWEVEHQLQLDRVIDAVATSSAGRKAVLLGDFRASREHLRDGVVVVGDRHPETLTQLEAAFTSALPPGFEPACTACPTNPLGPSAPLWPNRAFLSGIPSSAVVSASRTYLGNVVAVLPSSGPSNDPTAALVPLAPIYGFAVTLALEP
jgi:hypothetical protein